MILVTYLRLKLWAVIQPSTEDQKLKEYKINCGDAKFKVLKSEQCDFMVVLKMEKILYITLGARDFSWAVSAVSVKSSDRSRDFGLWLTPKQPAAREKKKPWPRVTYMYIYALNGESYLTAYACFAVQHFIHTNPYHFANMPSPSNTHEMLVFSKIPPN